jgi:hypothetical protein
LQGLWLGRLQPLVPALQLLLQLLPLPPRRALQLMLLLQQLLLLVG